MLNQNINDLIKDMDLKYDVDWYLLNINPLTNGSAMITVYGEGDKYE